LKTRFRPIATNAAVALCASLAAVLLVEMGVRLFHVPVEPLEIGEIEEWDPLTAAGFTPPLNDLGFREKEPTAEVLSDERTRILFLGDSFTFGQGVDNGAERFSDRIEERLNRSAGGDPSTGAYHIYNAGLPGSDPEYWLDYYKLLAPLYRPDHVFAVFFLRDGTDICTSLRCYEDVIAEIKGRYTGRLLYRHSHLARIFYDRRIHREFSRQYTQDIVDAYLGTLADRLIWIEQQRHLLELRDLSEASGASFHLVIFPILFKLDSGYEFHEVEQEITRFAAENEISVFSLTDGFLGLEARTLWVSPSDQHPNELGHRVAADTLYPYVSAVVSDGPPD